MRIRDLQLRSKLIVDGLAAQSGMHRSLRHGSSVEFSEYRAYCPGDDPRSLDWKLFGRSDRYFIKKFEDETNRRCYVVVDQSHSMSYGTGEISKLEYARTLAATLAYYLTTQRDEVGLMTFDEAVADVVPPRQRVGQLRRILACLDRAPTGRGTTVTEPLREIAAVARQRGLVILISDLMTPAEEVRSGLALLRGRGHEVLCLRILDSAEQSWSIETDRMIVDMETGRRIQVDPTLVAQQYQDAFTEHASNLQRVCEGVGATLFTMSSDSPLRDALANVLTVYNRQGVQVRRSGMLSGGSVATGAGG
ncbi:MAG: DUF58 domain-containing protein [Planctomycetota bacterium]